MKNVKRISSLLVVSMFLTSVVPVNALTKNETVYSKLNDDGSVKSTIVSEYLKNSDETISDETNLKNILNLNGNEKYKLEGTSLTWEAGGRDIYYQGETEEELPVSLEISYKLDGKSVKLDDLLGEKGKVEITLKYTNHEEHTVTVNGKSETLYTPFIVTLGTLIPNKNNSNIEVTNGKVVSNGTNSVVVAIASPGLYESLNTDKLKDFDTITITFDTEKFELPSIYSAISAGMIKEDDLDVFDRLDSVYSSVNKLTSSSKQLVNGSNELMSGAKKLSEGTSTLASGINTAYKGSKTISDELATAINTTKNSEALSSSELSAINSQAASTVMSTIKDNEATTKASGSTYIAAYQAGLDAQIAAYDCTAIDCTTDATYLSLVGAKTVLAGLLANTDYAAVLNSLAGNVAYGSAVTTANSIAENNAYASVAKQVADGAKEKSLASLDKLNSGLGELTTGLNKLNSGAQELVNGTNTLSNGVSTLAEGMSKFDSEGIGAIDKLVNGDLKTTEGKIKALVKLGDAYDTFTMKSDDTEGETKFVLMIDAKKASTKSTSSKKNTKSSSKK